MISLSIYARNLMKRVKIANQKFLCEILETIYQKVLFPESLRARAIVCMKIGLSKVEMTKWVNGRCSIVHRLWNQILYKAIVSNDGSGS